MTLRATTLILIATLTLPLALAAGNGFDVGATGRCFDEDGSGGEAALVSTDEQPVPSNVEANVLAAVDAVSAFTDDPAAIPAGKACTSESATDYVEAHVFVDATDDGNDDVDVEVCYAGNVTNIPNERCYPDAP